jgi:hypothetical protein
MVYLKNKNLNKRINYMTSLISWQKWFDPFGSDDAEEFEHDPYLGDYEEDELDESFENDNHEKEQEKKIISTTQRVKVIATPMGIIPVTDNTMSGKIFNFWIGHTNFDITHKVSDIIEKTDGVETLDIFTRYRFRIAIGKAFDDSSVMRDINKRVYSELS